MNDFTSDDREFMQPNNYPFIVADAFDADIQ
jgi:hypothetical protein